MDFCFLWKLGSRVLRDEAISHAAEIAAAPLLLCFQSYTLCKFVYLPNCLINIFLSHHGRIFCVKEKLYPFPHRQSSLVLCFIPQVGTSGVKG